MEVSLHLSVACAYVNYNINANVISRLWNGKEIVDCVFCLFVPVMVTGRAGAGWFADKFERNPCTQALLPDTVGDGKKKTDSVVNLSYSDRFISINH